MQQCTSAATMSFSAAVLLYEGFVYNVIFLGRILPALGRGGQVVPLAVLFNFLYLMAAWSYLKAHATDPGTIPERWQEFVKASSLTIPVFAAVPQWQPGKVTFCKMCDRTRPERAHHCHHCNVCVLRFDHHCLWINNCVGFNNHKHFLLVGVYCCVGLLVALATSFPELVYCAVTALRDGEEDARDAPARDESSPVRLSEKCAFLVFGVLGFSISTLLAAMLFVHLPRAAENLTAPEANYTNMANPFDRGSAVANMEQIFGAFGLDWLLPVNPHKRVSDGLSFQHADDPEWLRLDDESEAEDLWRLRYDAG
eukprot:CAMPEP_0204542494 /NCGR_PEP_ID=MMETSP0661-20131031/19019_1 /ASSEMBLY_ACC=CAM_ASM_000606 /TAXON_ID=109239 /ORGANISM="Alexandrium margalefi, Strain AMGDE01CS-322" /LENGTH=310 /DNA_ID=CAMNT_0051549199 /DNA_START=1 /DNA_END=930 /DNA_ORIENTATION=+